MFRFLQLLTVRSSVTHSSVTRWAVIGVLLATAAAPLCAQGGAEAPAASAEARLLEGELIELGEGDIAGALEIYESLLASAELSDAIRARTLFAIARAHRKLGELGAAKTRYQELIAKYPAQVKLVQAAHRYVAEIDAGANQLPEFDWAAQVEQNPEIQAQIFEWGMQLVGTLSGQNAGEAAGEAYRKLLALGPTAIPVLEPMLERTRSREHRKNLSAVLIQLGRPEHLPAYVSCYPAPGYGGLPVTIPRILPELSAETRARGLAVLDQIPAAEKSKIATLRIALGDYSKLEDDIVEMSGDLSLLDHLWDDPTLVPRLRATLIRLGGEDFDRYVRWLPRLLGHRPELVRTEELSPLLAFDESPSHLSGLTQTLLELERYDDVLLLLSGTGASYLIFINHRVREGQMSSPLDWSQYPFPVPIETRAKILRQMGESAMLLHLALTDDAAIPELATWIESFGARWNPTERDDLTRVTELTVVFEAETWIRHLASKSYRAPTESDHREIRFSPAFEKAMRGLFKRSKDPWVRSLALDLLERNPGEATPETVQFWSALFAQGEGGELEDATLLQLVLYGLADRSRTAPAAGCSTLLTCYRAIEIDALRESPLAHPYTRGHTLLLGTQRLGVESQSLGEILHGAIIERWGGPWAKAWIEGLLRAPGLDGDCQVILMSIAVRHGPLASAITKNLDRFSDRELQREWVRGQSPRTFSGLPRSTVTSLIEDSELPLDWRTYLVAELANRTDVTIEDALRWPRLILGGDAIAPVLVESFGNREFMKELALASRRAEQVDVRAWGWRKTHQVPASIEELRAGLEDSEESVRRVVLVHLLASENAEVVPLLHEVARSGAVGNRLLAIDRITEFAELSSVRVMQSLLDDPLLSIKTRALRSLEAMEATRAERAKWRRRVPEPAGGSSKEGF